MRDESHTITATLAAFAVVALGSGAGCRQKAAEDDEDKPAPATVTCRAVEPATIDDAIDVAGVIAPPPKLDAIVSSPVAGRVAQVVVEEGDRVAAGALLAAIEDPALTAGSLETRAAVDSARAQKTAADQEVARQERLVQSGIGARKDLDDARAKQAAAAGELAAASARSGLAGAQLARREIRAPRAGVVLHVQRKVGESVDGTAATPIAEIADITVLELHAQATPSALRPLRDGMTATVRPLGSDPVAGTVVRVAPAVDPATMLGLVRVALADGAGIKVGFGRKDGGNRSFDTTPDRDLIPSVAERAVRRCPALEDAPVMRVWAGLYEMTPDQMGILSAVPGVDGLHVIAGFSGHGFMHGPVAGQLMAELVADGRAHTVDVAALDIDRFRRGDAPVEVMTFA